MANYQILKADIDEKIYENAQQKITGENLNSVLNAMVSILGAEYQFAGVATIDTNPETSDAKVFYIANGKGTYTNFGGINVTEDDVIILYYDTSWHKVATGIASQAKLTELATDKVNISVGKNKANPSLFKLNIAIMSDDGTEYDWSSTNPNKCGCTDYIPVSQNGLTINYNISPGSSLGLSGYAVYDSSKSFIRGVKIGKKYTYQEGDAFIRYTFDYSHRNEIQVEEGEIVTDYEEYSPIGGYVEKQFSNIDNAQEKLSELMGYEFVSPATSTTIENVLTNLNILSGEKFYLKVDSNGTWGRILILDNTDERIADTNILNFINHEYREFVAPHNIQSLSLYIYDTSTPLTLTAKTKDGRVEILEKSVTTLGEKNKGCVRKEKTLSASNSTLTFDFYNEVSNGLSIAASFNISTLSSIIVGFKRPDNEVNEQVEITPTELIYSFYGGTRTYSVEHGLTISDNLVVLVRKYIANTGDETSKFEVKIMNEQGSFIKEWSGIMYNSTPFVKSTGGCVCKAIAGIENKDIWIFGDSYLSCIPRRWIYYLFKNNYGSKCLVDAHPGEGSARAYQSLLYLLKVSKPKYIIWCLGMNDGTDSTTPSSTWLEYMEKVKEICKENFISLIMATIPTVPDINHEAKNAFVKDSGYQYVDFAFAVGADSSGEWHTGMLSTDEVHPTEKGAKALYNQCVCDVPQLR